MASMQRGMRGCAVATVAAVLAGCVGSEPASTAGAPAGDVDWPHYLGDLARSHASPLAQIDATNVAELELAWSYDTGPLDEAGALAQIQCSPIVVDGVLYGTTPRSHPFAVDAATG